MSGFENKELSDLRVKLFDAKQRKAVADNEIKYLQGKISERLSESAAQLFLQQAKIAGDITFEIDNCGKFKASISKTVKWDSGKLQSIAATMPWPEVVGLFKIDFSVSEANYRAAATMKPELAAKLDEARTTKYGDLTIAPIED